MDKKEQLQWLLDNVDRIHISEIYPNGIDGTPTLLIEFDDWETAEASPFERKDCCFIFE